VSVIEYEPAESAPAESTKLTRPELSVVGEVGVVENPAGSATESGTAAAAPPEVDLEANETFAVPFWFMITDGESKLQMRLLRYSAMSKSFVPPGMRFANLTVNHTTSI
jgi:hypothetical protein